MCIYRAKIVKCRAKIVKCNRYNFDIIEINEKIMRKNCTDKMKLEKDSRRNVVLRILN